MERPEWLPRLLRLVVIAALAALGMTVWGIFFWNSPLAYQALQDLSNENAAAQALRVEFPESGAYMLRSDTSAASPELREIGPVATVYIDYPGNLRPVDCATKALPLAWASTFLMGWAVSRVHLSRDTYRHRVFFVLLAGTAAALFSRLATPVWWSQPLRWHAVGWLYDASAWFWAGCILAFLAGPLPVPTPPAPPSPQAPPNVWP
jgi:hypothetical protein